MNISQKGLDIIKKFEGFKNKVYMCPAGKPSIGYGHVLLHDESFTSITEAQAEELLRKDIKIAENAVKKHVAISLNQSEFDALVSLVYNWGGGNFAKSKGLRKLNINNKNGAWDEFSEVIRSNGVVLKGLVERRKQEKELFFSSDV